MPGRSFKWVQPVVLPLFAAVGCGIIASAIIMSRKLLHDPAVTMWRSQRGVETTEEQGKKYRENMLQRMVAGRPHYIIPERRVHGRAPAGHGEATPTLQHH
ncbi:hypothetical protein WJX81_003985 [Elliptochloris bilobata]|uniref:Uncharacterized protein n=1 Tax=Elliptochloris bilobata TaxID=381761 RepID=A0AAW1RX03_9CHLO